MATRAGNGAFGPTRQGAREPVLDALRGGALLGILLVNIHLMRGPDIWRIVGGDAVEPTGTADRVVAAVTGWLVAGKFISSFALLFGVGAALIARRAAAAGRGPRGVLVRRSLWLLVFGLAHMVLLFPGDILFLYGLAGLLLVLFLDAPTATIRGWVIGLVVVPAVLASLLAAAGAAAGGGGTGPSADPFRSLAEAREEQALAAFVDGSYLDVVVANVWQAAVVQSSQLLVLPWVLALFLVGYLVGRDGWVGDLASRRPSLRRAAAVGLLVGLPLNLPLAASGPLGADGPAAAAVVSEPLLAFAVSIAQFVGAPLLAVGYLAAAALGLLQVGAPRGLAAIGRVALSGYLLQSLLALLVFAGLGLYGQLAVATSLLVVATIWVVLLAVSLWWTGRFPFGPAEWAWRALTYRGG